MITINNLTDVTGKIQDKRGVKAYSYDKYIFTLFPDGRITKSVSGNSSKWKNGDINTVLDFLNKNKERETIKKERETINKTKEIKPNTDNFYYGDAISLGEFNWILNRPETLVLPHILDVKNGFLADNDLEVFNYCYCYTYDSMFFAFIQYNNSIKKYEFIRATTTYGLDGIENIEDIINNHPELKIGNRDQHISIRDQYNTSEEAILAMCKFMKNDKIQYYKYPEKNGEKIELKTRQTEFTVDELINKLKEENIDNDFDSIYDYLTDIGIDKQLINNVLSKVNLNESYMITTIKEFKIKKKK